ncbi:MAG: alpha/beta fold hydrolase [Pseudomonadota bacterium]
MAVTLTHLEHASAAAEADTPVLIAHGLFGSARNFNSLGRRLATNRRVVQVDMRNHGDAPWAEAMDYPLMAEDLADAIDRLCGGRAVVLGHSMGGKAAMALALSQPDRVAAVLVADIAPIAHGNAHGGYIRAMGSLDLSLVRRRSDADPALADAVPDAGLRAFLLQNLRIEGGEARWRLNLRAIEAAMPDLIGWPGASPTDWPVAPYQGPAFFLRGSASDYVPLSTHPAILRLFPGAEFDALEGAGHWLHAEQPEAFFVAVSSWLHRI